MIFSFSEKLVAFILGAALLSAFVFGTSLSLPLQSLTLLLLAVSGTIAALCLFDKKKLPLPALFIGMLFSVCYFGIRAYYSPVVDLGRDDLFLILAAGLLYVVGGYLSAGSSVRIFLAYSVLLGLSLNLGSAVMQFKGGEGIWPLAWFADVTRPSGSLITGIYGYRGSFANFVAVAGLVALSLGFLGRYYLVVRGILFSAGGLAIVGVILSNSRSAVTSLVVGGFVMLCLLFVTSGARDQHYKKRFRISLCVVGLIVLIGGPCGAYYVFNERSTAEEVGIEVFFSDSARSGYWPMAISQIAENSLIGDGSRSFSYENYKHWNPNVHYHAASPMFVHNEYLQIATDYGLIGLFIILVILGVHFTIGFRRVFSITKRLRDSKFEHSNELALCVAGLVGLIVMAVHMIFDFRTHLQSNLLLATCCLLWVLPVKVATNMGKLRSYLIAGIISILLVFVCVLSAHLGFRELKAGIPLMEAKLAFESNSWNINEIDTDEDILALEKSIKISPSYTRHIKLGTIYHQRSQGEELSSEEAGGFLNKALEQYLLAEERHPFDPVIKANLANIYSQQNNYDEAQAYFDEALGLSGNRGDHLFKLRHGKARVMYQEALDQWSSGNVKIANQKLREALENLNVTPQNQWKTRKMYIILITAQIKVSAEMKDFEYADQLIQESRLYKNKRARQLSYLNLAEYYYQKGMYVWYQRKPEKAMKHFMQSRDYYVQHKRRAKGKVDQRWTDGFKTVEERLAFFRKTNIKASSED